MKRLLLFFPIMMVVSLGVLFFDVVWGLIGIGATLFLAAFCGLVSGYFFNREKMPCELVYKNAKGELKISPNLDWKKRNELWGIKFRGRCLYRELSYAFNYPNVDPVFVFSLSTNDPEYQRLEKTISLLYNYGLVPYQIENYIGAKSIYIHPLLPLE